MAYKRKTHKRKPHAKRRRRTHHAMHMPVRRRRHHSRKHGLSEMFNAQTAHAAAQVVGAGALGGFAAGALNRILTKQNTTMRLGIELGASFVTYAVLGYPSMSAGMAGAFAAIESVPVYNKFLAEGEDMFAEEDSINELPLMMNEEGEVISLQEDGSGNMVYLNEATGETTLAEDVYLQEEAYLQEDASIYPDYSTEY